MFYVFKHGRAALQRIDWRLLGWGSRDWGVQISHGEAPLNSLNSRTGTSSRGGAGQGRGIRSGRGVLVQASLFTAGQEQGGFFTLSREAEMPRWSCRAMDGWAVRSGEDSGL